MYLNNEQRAAAVGMLLGKVTGTRERKCGKIKTWTMINTGPCLWTNSYPQFTRNGRRKIKQRSEQRRIEADRACGEGILELLAGEVGQYLVYADDMLQ